MAERRQLGGVFVWSLEGVVLGVLTYGLQQSLAALNVLPVRVAHEWVLVVVVLSSAVQLITQLALAAWHKQDALVSGDISDAVLNSFALASAEGSDVSEKKHVALVSGKGSKVSDKDDVLWKTVEVMDKHATNSALHKAVAQAHLCVLFFATVVYVSVLVQGVQHAQWAAVFFATSPVTGADALTVLVGVFVCMFLFVSLIIALCNCFAATPLGERNTLVLFSPLVLTLCMVYPLLHEIGTRELFFCTTAETNLLAMLFVNFAIATSFLFFVLDVVEFDACNVLPDVLHSRVQGEAGVRLYLMLHAVFVAAGLTVYVILVPTVPVAITILFLAAAIIAAASSLVSLPAALRESTAKFRLGQRKRDVRESESGDDTPTAVVVQPTDKSFMRLRNTGARRLLAAGHERKV
ncbi:MAG: hypothetical protein ACO3RW_02610 [Burkholderiaceae bacterium]|jgi:hypothetical protein